MKEFQKMYMCYLLVQNGKKNLSVEFFLEAAQPRSFRDAFHRLHCSIFMHCNSIKNKKPHTVLWHRHSKFNRDSGEGKQIPVHSYHKVS